MSQTFPSRVFRHLLDIYITLRIIAPEQHEVPITLNPTSTQNPSVETRLSC